MQYISHSEADQLYGYNDEHHEVQNSNQHHQMVCQEMTAQAITNNEDWWRLKHQLKSVGAGTNAAILQQLHLGVRERVKEEQEKQRRRSISPTNKLNMAAAVLVTAELSDENDDNNDDDDDDRSLPLQDEADASGPQRADGNEACDPKWYRRGSIGKILPANSPFISNTEATAKLIVTKVSRRSSQIGSFLRPTEEGGELLCDFKPRPRRQSQVQKPQGWSPLSEGATNVTDNILARSLHHDEDEEEVPISDKQGFLLTGRRRKKNSPTRLSSWLSNSSNDDNDDDNDPNAWISGRRHSGDARPLDYGTTVNLAAAADPPDRSFCVRNPTSQSNHINSVGADAEDEGDLSPAESGFFRKKKDALRQTKQAIGKKVGKILDKFDTNQERGAVLEDFRPRQPTKKHKFFRSFRSNRNNETPAEIEASTRSDGGSLDAKVNLEPDKETQFVPDAHPMAHTIVPTHPKESWAMVGMDEPQNPVPPKVDLSGSISQVPTEGDKLPAEKVNCATQPSEFDQSVGDKEVGKVHKSEENGETSKKDSTTNECSSSGQNKAEEAVILAPDMNAPVSVADGSKTLPEQQAEEVRPQTQSPAVPTNERKGESENSGGTTSQHQRQGSDFTSNSDSRLSDGSRSGNRQRSRRLHSTDGARSSDHHASNNHTRSRRPRSTDSSTPGNSTSTRRPPRSGSHRSTDGLKSSDSATNNGSTRSRKSSSSSRSNRSDSTAADNGSTRSTRSHSTNGSKTSVSSRNNHERKARRYRSNHELKSCGNKTNSNTDRPKTLRSADKYKPSNTEIKSDAERSKSLDLTEHIFSSNTSPNNNEKRTRKVRSTHGSRPPNHSSSSRARKTRKHHFTFELKSSDDSINTDSDRSRTSRSTDVHKSSNSQVEGHAERLLSTAKHSNSNASTNTSKRRTRRPRSSDELRPSKANSSDHERSSRRHRSADGSESSDNIIDMGRARPKPRRSSENRRSSKDTSSNAGTAVSTSSSPTEGRRSSNSRIGSGAEGSRTSHPTDELTDTNANINQ